MAERDSKFAQVIAQELRSASNGSFPLSPGTMDGHYAVARLYSDFRKKELSGLTVRDVFGQDRPEPPAIFIPKGHINITSTDGVNNSVWQRFLENAFVEKPQVDVKKELRSLIDTNAQSDVDHFDTRLAGGASHLLAVQRPSLLRAFLYEGMFPETGPFWDFVFKGMRHEVSVAVKGNFREGWTSSLESLVTEWKNHYPKEPFIK